MVSYFTSSLRTCYLLIERLPLTPLLQCHRLRSLSLGKERTSKDFAVLSQFPSLHDLRWMRHFTIEEAVQLCDLAQSKHIELQILRIETPEETYFTYIDTGHQEFIKFESAHYLDLLKRISTCEHIRELDLDECYLTAEMYETLFTGSGMKYVTKLSLPDVSHLEISYFRTSVKSIIPLLPTHLPNLSELRQVDFPPASFAEFTPITALRHLQSVTFLEAANIPIDTIIAEEMIPALARMSPTLTELDLPYKVSESILLSAIYIRQLEPLHNLQIFSFPSHRKCSANQEVLRAFCETIPHIRKLPYLQYDEGGLSPILSLHELSGIVFENCNVVTDDFIDSLITSCPNLISLALYAFPLVTMSIFRSLSRSISLQSLSVDRCAGIPNLLSWLDDVTFTSRPLVHRACALGSLLTSDFILKHAPLLRQWDIGLDWFRRGGNKVDGVSFEGYNLFYSLVHHVSIPIKLYRRINSEWQLLRTETVSYEKFIELIQRTSSSLCVQ